MADKNLVTYIMGKQKYNVYKEIKRFIQKLIFLIF